MTYVSCDLIFHTDIVFLGPKCRIDSLLGGGYIYDKADWGQYAERMRNELPPNTMIANQDHVWRNFFWLAHFFGGNAKNQNRD